MSLIKAVKSNRNNLWIAFSFLLIMIILAWYFMNPNSSAKVSLSENPSHVEASIAVLPFVNLSGDSTQEYFSDGLTDGILNSLAHLKGLKVSSRNSSFIFRGKDVDIKEVGEKLRVHTILQGSIQIQEDRIRITAQLINAEDGFHFWSEQYNEKWEDIFSVQDKIANAIANKLKITMLTNEGQRMKSKPTPDKDAYELYLKARSYWNLRTPPNLKKSVELYEQAIQLDSTFAAAYAGLADSFTALGYGSYLAPKDVFIKAKEHAIKAIQLDSTLAEPHASLAYYHLFYGWDWSAAEQEFRIAIALNPNYALAYDWYGVYLTAMERYDEARIILQKAAALDPLSVSIDTDMGFTLYYSGNYDEAMKRLQATLTVNPQFGIAHLWLGRTYQQKKMYDEAIREYKKALDITADWPPALAALGNVYGISGNHEAAQQTLNALNAISSNKFVTSYGIALVYAGLGENAQTFLWLNKAYEERSNWLVWIKTDPRWAFIRGEKQYEELVSKVGLPR